MTSPRLIAFAALIIAAPAAWAAQWPAHDGFANQPPMTGCYEWGAPPASPVLPPVDPLLARLAKYTTIAASHRVNGLASYYSTFFDGRKTANGEIYRNRKFSAAHLTLPLGTWVEVTSRATGKKLRLRVNDRGPYAKKFCLDLSQAAARFLGVDVAPDRHVDIRIIALPGEDPLPENIDAIASASTAVISAGLLGEP
jgi:rare lipoprotein A (peptidoglycan hydrolase)